LVGTHVPHQEAYCLNQLRFSSEDQKICAKCSLLRIIVTAPEWWVRVGKSNLR